MSPVLPRNGIRLRVLSALAFLLAATVAASGLAYATPSSAREDLAPRVSPLLHEPVQRGLPHRSPGTGEVVYPHHDGRSDRPGLFRDPGPPPGVFGVDATRPTSGGDPRFTTPVHAVEQRRGTTSDDGHVAFTDTGPTYANGFTGTTLTPHHPPAGTGQPVRQARDSGNGQADGRVGVDRASAPYRVTAAQPGQPPARRR